MSRKIASGKSKSVLCRGGGSFGCHTQVEHPPKWPKIVEVYLGDASETAHERMVNKRKYFKFFELNYEESKALYQCRNCGAGMGCAVCAQRPTELVCLACHDHANKYGEMEHGKMLRPGSKEYFEAKREADKVFKSWVNESLTAEFASIHAFYRNGIEK